MERLGDVKQRFLDQVKANRGQQLFNVLVWYVKKYDDLEPNDFRGIIEDDKVDALIEACRDNPKERELWSIISNTPMDTFDNVSKLREAVLQYIWDFPFGPKIDQVIEIAIVFSEEVLFRSSIFETKNLCFVDEESDRRCSPIEEERWRIVNLIKEERKEKTHRRGEEVLLTACQSACYRDSEELRRREEEERRRREEEERRRGEEERRSREDERRKVLDEIHRIEEGIRRDKERKQRECREEQLMNADKNVPTNTNVLQRKSGKLIKILRIFKRAPKQDDCNSALFAPAEIAKGNDMLVQVYIYREAEEDSIASDAQRTDEDAVQRGYTPLCFPVQQGDKLTVRLNMHGLQIEGDSIQDVIWQGRYTKCSFWVPIPKDYSKMKVAGDAYISRNGLELGRMAFFSKIADCTDSKTSCKVDAKMYKKVFISYSHKDNDTVKAIADAYKALGVVDYFYDRHTLAPGEFFEKKIYDFIDNCDLFILCWSKNAEKSEWVTKERVRAFYVATDDPSRLRLYPINISPKAAPPDDLRPYLHFEDYDTLMKESEETA